MKIILNCRKAYEKLKGGFKIRTTSKRLKVYIPNGMHIDVYGRSMPMSVLIFILCNGRPDMVPRDFVNDAPRLLRTEVINLFKSAIIVQSRNTNNPNDLGEIYVDFSGELLEQQVVALVKQWIFDGSYYKATAPNKPSTIRNKGGADTPLVHTGMLANSITARIDQ